MRKALGITLVLMVAFCTSAFARPADNSNALDRLYQMDLNEPSLQYSEGVFGAAIANTVYFGGTAWDGVDHRWEAIQGGTWGFDSGVASAFTPTHTNGDSSGAPVQSGLTFDPAFTKLNPYKSSTLHSIMEGWIGWDNSYSEQTQFRRLSTGAAWASDVCVGAPYIPSGGTFSYYAGLLPAEGVTLCWADSGGYGNAWSLCIDHAETYNGIGSVTWSWTWGGDSEPGFDYNYAIVDTTGPLDGDDAEADKRDSYFAPVATSQGLVPGDKMRSDAGPVIFKFCFVADGAYSDQDGLYPTACGAVTVDNISITGGGITHAATFESGPEGWALPIFPPGPGEELADIVHLDDLPPPDVPCVCRMNDSVLVFQDVDLIPPGHGTYSDNLAASPVIDLEAAGLVGVPGKYIEYDGYFALILTNYILVQTNVKWHPLVCPLTGGLLDSPWTSDGFVRYVGGGVPTCTTSDTLPFRVPFGARVDAAAKEMQIALGAINYCRFFPTNCSGATNSTPWFDNVRLGVYGQEGAPLIATRTLDFAIDAFPVANSLDPGSPGRMDAGIVKGFTTPEPYSALGDTMTVTGGGAGTQVFVLFNVCPGPGINTTALNDWLTGHADVTGTVGATRAALGTWYQARMDTAEQGGAKTATRSWMTAYHESDPNFTGTDGLRAGDLDPLGRPRLVNDIFPDDLFTPGTRVNYFYRTSYVSTPGTYSELPIDPALNFVFGEQEGTTGFYEFEVLPSSMDTTGGAHWNCVLYVDHFDGRGAQQQIEVGLATLLTGGSANCENTAWDRYDVEGPSSQQASLGRAANTQYGATVIHILGYSGIIWNSGNLEAFNMVKEDADALDPWATIGTTMGIDTYNKFYDSGDGSVASITLEQLTETSALVFMNQLCGVALRCRTYRDATCNSPNQDATPCVDIDPVGVGTPAEGRTADSVVGNGNGCPQLRSFDILEKVLSTRYGAVPVEDEAYNTVINALGDDYASIALDQDDDQAGATYSTVVDGISVHYRRVKGAASSYCTTTETPITGRLDEVLSWLSLTPASDCTNPAQLVDVPNGQPKFKTSLANFAPNPLFSGATGTIQFTMAKEGKASVDIFDVNGRLVRTVFDGSAKAGVNVVHWNGKDASDRQVASGVYFTRFRAGKDEFARKMVVVAGNGN